MKTDSQSTQNKIIFGIKKLINDKNLEPGDKIPSERTLSEQFSVTRSCVRNAIQKLEFYGLLNSIPQSGTFVANIGVVAMNGMVDDILNLEDADFKSLVEMRILLELKTVRLAALRRSENDLYNIKKALDAHKQKIIAGEDAVQEDLLFHLAIAKASGNTTMNTFMLMITPKIITKFERYHVCNDKDINQTIIEEHLNVYDAILKKDASRAKEMMKKHFKTLYQYCYNV